MFCLFVLYARTVGSSLSIYSTYKRLQSRLTSQSLRYGKPLQIGNRPADSQDPPAPGPGHPNEEMTNDKMARVTAAWQISDSVSEKGGAQQVQRLHSDTRIFLARKKRNPQGCTVELFPGVAASQRRSGQPAKRHATCHGATCPAFFLDIYRDQRARKFFRHMVTFAPFWATGETCRTETESALGDMSH